MVILPVEDFLRDGVGWWRCCDGRAVGGEYETVHGVESHFPGARLTAGWG